MKIRAIVLALGAVGAVFAVQQALAQSAQADPKAGNGQASQTNQKAGEADPGRGKAKVPRLKAGNSGDGVEEEEEDL